MCDENFTTVCINGFDFKVFAKKMSFKTSTYLSTHHNKKNVKINIPYHKPYCYHHFSELSKKFTE